MLDCGTGTGKNLAPYLDTYPGIECYGMDVSAPGLRYGHAQWEAQGKALHLSQQNAEQTDFPDGYFDLIVSSFFFHEIPVASTKRILQENYRLLAPGGRIAHMELPPNCEVDPYYAFYLDWDGYNNNEPDYVEYRSQVPKATVRGSRLSEGELLSYLRAATGAPARGSSSKRWFMASCRHLSTVTVPAGLFSGLRNRRNGAGHPPSDRVLSGNDTQ